MGRFLSLCALAGSGAWLASGCSGRSRVFDDPAASGGLSGGANGTGGDGDTERGGTETSTVGAGGVEKGEAGAGPERAGAPSEIGGAETGGAGGAAGVAGVECAGGCVCGTAVSIGSTRRTTRSNESPSPYGSLAAAHEEGGPIRPPHGCTWLRAEPLR
jgi:hypothetical protein